MRAILLTALALVGGCGDDTTMGPGAGGDLAMPMPPGEDLSSSGSDGGCSFRGFPGFAGDNSVFRRFDCSCGCSIDSFENNLINDNWGINHTSGAMFVPMQGVGLGVSLVSSGNLEQGGLTSEGPIARFYLDGDFDILVDYDLGATAPPGESHLLLGVRLPTTLTGTPVYEVERLHGADGSDAYGTMLGGVPSVYLPTTATHGTLRLTRRGYLLTSYADGQKVSMLIAQTAGRLVVTLAATLAGCTAPDAGSTCGYTPRWHLLHMQTGSLVNQP
jgi:hypothetical protein